MSTSNQPFQSHEAPVLIPFSDIEPEKVDWLWPGRIALGVVTVIAGHPGTGKSFLTCDMASRVSTGRNWPDGSPCEQGEVIILSAEDDPNSVIRPRLDDHNADVSKIKLLKGKTSISKNGESTEGCVDLSDSETFKMAAEMASNLKLLVIDPIGSFVGSEANANSDTEIRSLLGPHGDLAREHNYAIVIVCHYRKSASDRADDRIMGSRAFTAYARNVHHLVADTNDPEKKLLLPGKSNLGPRPTGRSFYLRGHNPQLEWTQEEIETTAEEMMAMEASQSNNGRSKESYKGRCKESESFLQELLKDGPLPAKEVLEATKANAISQSTLNRAKRSLGIKTCRHGFGASGEWRWTLPEDEPCSSVEDAQPPEWPPLHSD